MDKVFFHHRIDEEVHFYALAFLQYVVCCCFNGSPFAIGHDITQLMRCVPFENDGLG